MSQKYFATLTAEELASQAHEKIRSFDNYLEKSGKARRIEKSEQLYFGQHMGGVGAGLSEVSTLGTDDELTAVSVNYYRNLIQHRKALTTSQKIAYDPRAINSDLRSLQQTRLSRNILEYYESEKSLGEHKSNAAERALVGAVGYVYMGWDKRRGRPTGTRPVIDKDGQPKVGVDGLPLERVVYEGDVFAMPKSATEVIYDTKLRDWKQNKWVIIENYENKWDLAAEYPEFESDIINLSSEDNLRTNLRSYARSRYLDKDSQNDLVATYTFYHLKTDAVPNGRHMKFLSNLKVLSDGPIPYQDKYESFLPVMRIAAAEVFNTVDGHTDSYDVIALQQVMNVLFSTVFTNQQAFGVQMVNLPHGTEVSPSHVKSMVFLKTPPGTEPKGINLTNTPAEIFKNIEIVQTAMTMLQGLNSVVTGDPDHNLKSGAALGRLQAMAIQYASNFQRQWANLNSECGTFLLKLLKWFAKTERMYALAGKRNKNAMASFSGSDLDLIDRVFVDLGNPLAHTAAGRLELADMLMREGKISLAQYFEVMETGTLDPISETEASEEELLQKENELFLEGKPVQALVGDKHKAHIKYHKSILNDPLLREQASKGDPMANAVVQSVMAHIQEHIQLEQTQDMIWFAVSGEQPPPPPPPALIPPSGPGGPAEPVPPPDAPAPAVPPIPPAV